VQDLAFIMVLTYGRDSNGGGKGSKKDIFSQNIFKTYLKKNFHIEYFTFKNFRFIFNVVLNDRLSMNVTKY